MFKKCWLAAYLNIFEKRKILRFQTVIIFLAFAALCFEPLFSLLIKKLMAALLKNGHL